MKKIKMIPGAEVVYAFVFAVLFYILYPNIYQILTIFSESSPFVAAVAGIKGVVFLGIDIICILTINFLILYKVIQWTMIKFLKKQIINVCFGYVLGIIFAKIGLIILFYLIQKYKLYLDIGPLNKIYLYIYPLNSILPFTKLTAKSIGMILIVMIYLICNCILARKLQSVKVLKQYYQVFFVGSIVLYLGVYIASYYDAGYTGYEQRIPIHRYR